MYVDIYFPAASAPRRAWLVPPQEAGEQARVTLETTRMNLGLDAPAPRVRYQTSLSGLGDWVYPSNGAWLQTESVTGSWVLGLTESETGNLTASSPPTKAATPPNDSSFEFELATTRTVPIACCAAFTPETRLSNPNAPLQTGLRYGPYTHGNRVLRAIPVPRTDTLPRRLGAEPPFSVYGTDFYLGWREPASTDGYPAFITFVSELGGIPSNRQQAVTGPALLRDPPIAYSAASRTRVVNRQSNGGVRRRSVFAGEPGYFDYHT